ncbi:MAG TPA: hypothetical protein VHG93_00135 [Longimicrobium sp.]|nr:hypothetical protein [Longimicrobium sp.]
MAGPVRGRRLLPLFRPHTNVPDLPPGRWTVLDTPTELAKLEVPRDDDGGLYRTRVQSVPSPWARLFLFRDAMLDPSHPARALVENEILDALELAWSSGPQSLRLETAQLRIVPLAESADAVSPRVRDYADALCDLAPRAPGHESLQASALPVLTVARVDGRPVFASSPYTILFTAEDAAAEAYPYLFRYAAGENARPLRARPFAFQRYVATVVLPQVRTPAAAPGEHVDADAVRRGVADWLAQQVADCRRASPGSQAELAPPADWRDMARELELRQAGAHAFAGVTLFTGTPGRLPSRWALRPTRPSDPPPLVLVPGHFDGVYGEGLPTVELPPELERLDRTVLPGTGHRRAWVLPERDWLADALVILSRPLDQANVHGFGSYRPDASVTDAPYAQPQMALPLKGEFFRHFTPQDVERMLTVEVQRPGEVRVTLSIPVGTDRRTEEIRVQRRYSGAQIRPDHVGPELVVWPSFSAADWGQYAVFRLDRQAGSVHPADALQVEAFAGGRPLAPIGHERRTQEAAAYAYPQAPEVLELVASTAPGLAPQALGVLLPKYRPAPPVTAERWQVGVDFGTSNTVVAVYRDGQREEQILEHDRVLLPLNRPGADLPFFVESFFVPERIEPRPFNTAVVYLAAIPAYDAQQEPVGLRVNIPFSGWVKDNERNRVAADLKWSSEPREHFLAAAFLRTTASLVLAHAREAGVSPGNVTFAYAYPRAFERDREDALRGRWRAILAPPGTPESAFTPEGAGPTDAPAAVRDRTPKLASPMDEGRSALRYFLGRGELSTAGELSVMLDVGGGTTDLAAFARSRALALDSLRWGGRDLTGPRVRRGERGGFTNPFVRAFTQWALEHGLPGSQQEPLRKYAAEDHDALAFSYLVRTPWYREGNALLFSETPEHGAFRGLVFYFFAALAYYTGVLHRAVREGGTDEPLARVVLAGNGSRFLEWLWRDWDERADNPFRGALLRILAHGAGTAPGEVPPRLVLSNAPKQEVARGLVTPSGGAARLEVAPNSGGSVVGEPVRIQRDGAQPREYGPTVRLPSHMAADERVVSGIRWLEGPMEIERFHEVLVQAAREQLAPVGGPWATLPARMQRAFRDLGPTGIQRAARDRLEALVRTTGGVPGSLFMVEAGAVLDHLMDVLFAPGGGA